MIPSPHAKPYAGLPGAQRWPRRIAEAATVLAGYAAVTLLMTWPVARRLGAALPSDLGDPLLLTWVLAWDADRLRHGLRGLWTAPSFYPYSDTLAYSDHLLGIAIPLAPVEWVGRNPVFAYNAAFLASFVLAGAGMYLLARSIAGRRDAAVLAGLAYAFCPYRAAQLSHLQLLMSGWMPIGLWALHRYFETRSRRVLAVFVAAFLLQALSSGYYTYYFAFMVAAAGMFELIRRRDAWRRFSINLTLAASAIAVALAPIVAVYSRVRREQHMFRLPGDWVSFAADVTSYLHTSPAVRVWRWLPGLGGSERELFPGLTVVVLAAATLWRRRPAALGDAPPPSATAHGLARALVPETPTGLYAAIAAAAFVLTLGPEPRAWGHRLLTHGPYEWVAAIVPGFDGLRVTARLVIVFYLALAVLAALGAARLFERLPLRRGRIICCALGLAILVEGYGGPIRTPAFPHDGGPDRRIASAWLRNGPPGAAIELPAGDAGWPEVPFEQQYYTLLHGRRIVNGRSGYGSALESWLGGPGSPLLDTDHLGDVLKMLRSIGIRAIVLQPSAYRAPDLGRATLDAFQAAGDQVTQDLPCGEPRPVPTGGLARARTRRRARVAADPIAGAACERLPQPRSARAGVRRRSGDALAVGPTPDRQRVDRGPLRSAARRGARAHPARGTLDGRLPAAAAHRVGGWGAGPARDAV